MTDAKKAIKALRDTDYKDSESYFKMVQLLKGLAGASKDDEDAKAFLDAVSDAMTDVAKKVLSESRRSRHAYSGPVGSLIESVLMSPMHRVDRGEHLPKNRVSESAMRESSERQGTVGLWLTYLSSYLTQYDVQQSRNKFHNPYSLSHYLTALDKVETDTKSIRGEDTPEAIAKLMTSLRKHFIYERGKFGLSPLNKLEKQISVFLDTGKVPKMLTSA